MPDPFDFYLSSPVVVNGNVYFGSGDGNVYALDAASGNLRWKFQTGDVVHASPAVANGTIYLGSWDSYFYALDAATGKAKWKFKTEKIRRSQPGRDPVVSRGSGWVGVFRMPRLECLCARCCDRREAVGV